MGNTSFKTAYDRIPKGDARAFIGKLRKALKVSSNVAVYPYIRGDREPRLTQAIAIERLFKEYGIVVNWGCEEAEKQDEL